MTKVKYGIGFECKCCGNIVCETKNYDAFCKECGAQIIEKSADGGWEPTNNANLISVKIICKFFSKTYQKASDLV